jgi:NDP-sugar pyrophosphorylase family protein
MKEAVILAGGRGLRLKPLTDAIPKSLVMIRNKPLIDYQIDWLEKNGYKRIIVACGYKHNILRKYLGNAVEYSVETTPLGTAGAVNKAKKLLQSENFLVINGDIITDLNLEEFEKIHERLSIVVVPLKCPFGVISEEGGKVVFQEKPKLPYWINAGIYLINKSVKLPARGDLERDVFPKEQPKIFRYEGFWKSIDTFKDVMEVEKELF